MFDYLNKRILVLFSVFLLLVSTPSVMGSVSTSPSSVSFDNLEVSTSDSQSVAISVENDNLQSVDVDIIGDTSENETVLKDILSYSPTYFSTIDNSENKTLNLDATNENYIGDYYGDILLNYNSGDYKIPLHVEGVENKKEVKITGGLLPDKGTIAAILPRDQTLSKTITVRNGTPSTLQDFDAYMKTTEIYDSIDWVRVSFSSPYSFDSGDKVEISLKVVPDKVPSGTHNRTLVTQAWTGDKLIKARVTLRITIYGEKTETEENKTVTSNVNIERPYSSLNTNEPMTVELDKKTKAKVYMGGEYLGTTDNKGELDTTAPLEKGAYTLEIRHENGSILATKSVVVKEKKSLAIEMEEGTFTIGEPIRGAVYTKDGPVARATVKIGDETIYTDMSGSFEMNSEKVGTGDKKVSVTSSDSGYVEYGSASTSISVEGGSNLYYYITIIAVVVGAFLVYRYKEEVLSFLSNLKRKVKREPKVPLQ